MTHNIIRPVYVEWHDSASISDWGVHSDADIETCRSIGWLVHQDKQKIVISTTLGEDNSKSIDRLSIPRSCIRTLRYHTFPKHP